ncbi:TRAP transporter large permease subunit [Oceanobacillus halophilus]|uniref:TRAP transporter large permease subunit n=1 Tax=Oceanobacillus halophilus TaxID=930130 RepID=A0A495AB02_9BACI|nr:TRAP transporter large permease subunit [Oceanobacillus halophilus]RKQ37267.1 TRAP transporter large permease subunit [Oceanobacillus halophilus]
MIEILVPLVLLFMIALVQGIPKIGGDIRAALIIATLSSAIISGLSFTETAWAFVDGIDRLSWVIMLSVFGSLYAESQVKLGTMDTTLNSLRAAFGNSPKGLIVAIFITLILAGSLLGDAIAAATVIGFLVIHSLTELKLKPEQIGMIILLGASIGSIMPPITQAVYLSSSLIGIDPSPVVMISYITVTIGAILAILESFRFVRGRKMPQELIPKQTVTQILKERWVTLIPLIVLIAIVIANTLFEYNIFSEWTVLAFIVEPLQEIPIIQGITFQVVSAIIIAFLVSFLFPSVRKHTGGVFKNGLTKVSKTVQIQLCAGIMVGVFYASGLIDKVALMTEGLADSMVKVGGALSLIVVGMLTGSQTTAQSVIVTFLGPILENMNVDPTMIALGASHIASAGQNLPPVGLTAFVVCGLIGGILDKKVDPLKVMTLAVPNSLYFIILGLIVWFI